MSAIQRSGVERLLNELNAVIAAVESGHSAAFDPQALGICTVTAAWLAEQGPGVVMGYWADDNPAAEVGALEGGHDFALLADRFIVDWWASAYPALSVPHPGLLDLRDPAAAALIERFYGPRSAWTLRTAD